MKRNSLLLLPLVLFIPGALAVEAEVEDLSDRAYLARAVKLIDQAKKSVTASLYQFDVDPTRPKHPATQLFQALLRAKERKVPVFLILNRNFELLCRGHPRRLGA